MTDDAPEKKKRVQPLFKKGHRVLVPHTDRHYAAMVLRGQKREDGYFYLVSYDGWSSKWDEWVEEAGVIKFDRSKLPVEEGGTMGLEGATTMPTGTKKRKSEVVAQKDEPLPSHLRMFIPPLLKKAILDDFDQVNNKGKCLSLPRKAHRRPTVTEILQSYQEAVQAEAEAAARDLRAKAEKAAAKAAAAVANAEHDEEADEVGEKEAERGGKGQTTKPAPGSKAGVGRQEAPGQGSLSIEAVGRKGSKVKKADDGKEAQQTATKKTRKNTCQDVIEQQKDMCRQADHSAEALPAEHAAKEEASMQQAVDEEQHASIPVDDTLVEILEGLRIYFDKVCFYTAEAFEPEPPDTILEHIWMAGHEVNLALPPQALRQFLLYGHEVRLCDDALKAGAAPSELYGAEHLLRLLVKLPELVPVSHVNPADRSILVLEDRLKDLMTWLTEIKQQARCFSMPEEYTDNPHYNPALAELFALPSMKYAAASNMPVAGDLAGAATPAPAD